MRSADLKRQAASLARKGIASALGCAIAMSLCFDAIAARRSTGTRQGMPADRAAPSSAKLEGGLAGSGRLGPAADFTQKVGFALPLYRRPYARIRFITNPLVSSTDPPTSEYTYLYVPSPVHGAVPLVASHRYVADNSYLLRPSWGYKSGASAYSWHYCRGLEDRPLPIVRTRSGLGSLDQPATTRNPGQKIDNSLRPDTALPPADGPRVRLSDAFEVPPWGSPRQNKPCRPRGVK